MTDIDGAFADLDSVLDEISSSLKDSAKQEQSSIHYDVKPPPEVKPRQRQHSDAEIIKSASDKQTSKSFLVLPTSKSENHSKPDSSNETNRPPPARSVSSFLNKKPFTLRERTKPQEEEQQSHPISDVSLVSNIVKKENLMEGYLLKLSKNKAAAKLGKKSWKKRYFVLSGGILTMYDSKGGKKRKEVSLLSVLFKENNDAPFSFEINTSEYVVVVRADDELSMHTWMNEILRQKQMRREQRVKDRTFVTNGTPIDFEEYKKIQMQEMEESGRKKKWENQVKKIESMNISKQQIGAQIQEAKKSGKNVKELEGKLSALVAELENEKKLERELYNDFSSINAQNEFNKKKKKLEDEMAELSKKKVQAADAEDFVTASKYKKELMQKEDEYKKLLQNS